MRLEFNCEIQLHKVSFGFQIGDGLERVKELKKFYEKI